MGFDLMAGLAATPNPHLKSERWGTRIVITPRDHSIRSWRILERRVSPRVEEAAVKIDPVCGMKVEPQKAAASVEHAGLTWYFCSRGCGAKFEADPARYDGSQTAPPPAIATSASSGYTCPMHPEVHSAGPGACPKCGMALEPLAVTATADNPELASMTRRLWISSAFTLPLLAMMIAGLFPGDPLQGPALGWIEFALATPVVLWGGLPFFERGWASIVHRSLNMFTLIAMGTGAAYLYSLAAVAAPALFPPSFRDPSGNLGLYFEAAAVITVLVLLGQVLELRARSQTGGAMQALLGMTPKTARRVSADGTESDVALDQVVPSATGCAFARAKKCQSMVWW